MNCVLFAKIDQIFGLKKNKNFKRILEKWKKILEKSGKSHGILSVRKVGTTTVQLSLSNGFKTYFPEPLKLSVLVSVSLSSIMNAPCH